MNFIDTPIRLVVKAPNQRVGDQTIECALSWTVEKLKTYLSDVYPSKPKTEDQKLIYSGQLLHDHLMLKDILRQYDQNSPHIVHLVCAPTRELSKSSSTYFNAENKSSENLIPETNNTGVPLSNDGVRHRIVEQSTQNQQPSSISQSIPSTDHHSAFVPAYPLASVPGVALTPEQMAQQMFWMQQMYTQYMSQYLQYVQTGTLPTQIPVISSGPPNPPEEAPSQNAPPPQRLQNENVRMNVQGNADDDDEIGPERDWLDWFYILSRALVLFSIVYFYSSLSRLFAVIVIITMVYLYQTGRIQFRQRRRHQDAQVRRPNIPTGPPHNEEVPNDDNNNRANQHVDVNEEQMRRETQEIENMMDNDIDNPAPPAVEPGPSIFNVTWSIVTGFFSSLIPEHPAPI